MGVFAAQNADLGCAHDLSRMPYLLVKLQISSVSGVATIVANRNLRDSSREELPESAWSDKLARDLSTPRSGLLYVKDHRGAALKMTAIKNCH